MLPNPFPDHISFCLLPIHSTSNQKLHPGEENDFCTFGLAKAKDRMGGGVQPKDCFVTMEYAFVNCLLSLQVLQNMGGWSRAFDTKVTRIGYVSLPSGPVVDGQGTGLVWISTFRS